MPSIVLCKDLAFNSGVGSGDRNHGYGDVNWSWHDELEFVLKITKADTDAADTLNGYVQSRGYDGVWEDRLAFAQQLGSASPTVDTPLVVKLQPLKQFPSSDELVDYATPRLTVGQVRHGIFPGRYWDPVLQKHSDSWRLQLVIVDADNNGDWEGIAQVTGNTAVG